jgi:Flp pilus assembly protein TadG
MPFRLIRRSRTRPFCRGFSRATDGSVAIEFAVVAFPFVLMVFAILELCLVFVLDSVLDNATSQTGRLVRTGQASAASMTPEQFKISLCSRMSMFAGDCADRVTVDVREIEQFAYVPPDPMKDGTFDPAVLTYTNGDPGDLMLVRVWYRHPLITTFLAQGLSRLNDGTVRLSAATAFRNEPA